MRNKLMKKMKSGKKRKMINTKREQGNKIRYKDEKKNQKKSVKK